MEYELKVLVSLTFEYEIKYSSFYIFFTLIALNILPICSIVYSLVYGLNQKKKVADYSKGQAPDDEVNDTKSITTFLEF